MCATGWRRTRTLTGQFLVDGSSATVETDAGVQVIDGHYCGRVARAALVSRHPTRPFRRGGSSLTSFVEVAGRKDGGDSVQGTGLEISPGLVFNNPESRLSVEARGRVLVHHSVDNHREYGASITARLMPRANSLGLSMAVSPDLGNTGQLTLRCSRRGEPVPLERRGPAFQIVVFEYANCLRPCCE